MQPRLMRSRTEVIIAGVCGGLAEYFAIDPVIVRLIFVLVTLTSGIGLLVYPILWLVMPKAGATTSGAQLFPHNAEEWRKRAQAFGEEASQVGQQFSREVREVLRHSQTASSQSRTAAPPRYTDAPPPPQAYNFDPQTGLPIDPPGPTTGKTVNLRIDPTEANLSVRPPATQFQPPPPRQGKRGRMLGFILLGVGLLVLANIFNIDQYVFPLLLIGAGVMLLRKR
ncbi:MAG TPA: PspC domain-containing protein [Roseiflexaceae bacterium]|nr:PspC domain-containing protein [Roseiflexaceae bacterium]